jgi:ribosome-binding factor A
VDGGKKMSEQRTQRVAEELRREISDILRHEMKDPRVCGLISITGVTVTRDLSYAKVYVSVFGSEQEQEAALTALSRASGFIRSEVGKRIRLRHTPEISFHPDRSIAYGAHINQVLRRINKQEREDVGE